MLLLLCIGFGCAADNDAASDLNSAVTDLKAKHYDDALTQANASIAADFAGPYSAEAYYVRGRAVEDRTKPDAPAAAADLATARADYVAALTLSPVKALQGQIRASLGNVAYFQEDYATAVEQLSLAYPLLTDLDSQSWDLYRLGVSQQRLGLFEDADQTYETVQRQFANSEPANRAREKFGARAFYVQLGAFSSQADANRAVSTARGQGLNVETAMDPDGSNLTLVRVGPAPTYAVAQSLKAAVTAEYPGASVVP